MSPTGSAANGEALARWKASPAYADMMAALASERWDDYETANAERLTDRERWARMHAKWTLAMQRRAHIDPMNPAKGAAGMRGNPSSAAALRMRSTRGLASGSARRRRGSE